MNDLFFSSIGDLTAIEEDWLEEHPEYNQIYHDIHVEAAEEMIDFILKNANDK